MEIELMTTAEMNSTKGGIWVYYAGEWVWIDDYR